MNPEQRDKLMRYLEAYLDGTLPAGQRAVFEDLIRRSDELRKIVSRQGVINDALKRRFAPPAALDAPDRAVGLASAAQPAKATPADVPGKDAAAMSPEPAADAQPQDQAARSLDVSLLETGKAAAALHVRSAAPRRFRTTRMLAVAASIVLVAGGLWLGWEPIRGLFIAETPAPPPPRTLVSIYHNEIAKGFKEQWLCKTDEEFAKAFRDRLGEPLVLGKAPPGVRPLGLSYTTAITPQTVFLLAYVDKKQVIVFVDRLSKDKPQTVSPDTGLKLYRREIGGFVLYELTPFDKPRLLELFRKPQSTTAP